MKDPRDHKTKGNQYKYVLDAIEPYKYSPEEGEIYVENPTDEEKIKFFFSYFESEFDHDYNKKEYPNFAQRVGEYLRGLPGCIHVHFSNSDIINIGKSWGYCKTEKKTDAFLNNWFYCLGQRLCELKRMYNV